MPPPAPSQSGRSLSAVAAAVRAELERQELATAADTLNDAVGVDTHAHGTTASRPITDTVTGAAGADHRNHAS